jgi:hypothetical protein
MTACDVYVRHPAGEVEVTGAPPEPPAEVEVRTPAPGPEYVWIGGEWRWGPDHRWEWQRGRWDRRPHAGAVWRASHYEYRNGHHVYVEGGWR